MCRHIFIVHFLFAHQITRFDNISIINFCHGNATNGKQIYYNFSHKFSLSNIQSTCKFEICALTRAHRYSIPFHLNKITSSRIKWQNKKHILYVHNVKRKKREKKYKNFACIWHAQSAFLFILCIFMSMTTLGKRFQRNERNTIYCNFFLSLKITGFYEHFFRFILCFLRVRCVVLYEVIRTS